MENRGKAVRYGIIGLLATALLTLLDQWTKHLAVLHLAGKNDIILIKGVFQLQYLENRGAAFGIFQNQIWIFVILTVIFLLAVIWIYFKIPREKKYLILHIVAVVLTAGAMGNFIDRIRLGYVVDFFYFSLIDFPIFNVADIFVVISFIIIAICILFIYKEEDFSFIDRNHKKQENN
ncbi:MAG: signal peptidase II [Clostridia bacterium]|nr:signal peptidase II [Clostridia bacterium]NCC44722.1 signal peptidase II [Clostridia bacterium]